MTETNTQNSTGTESLEDREKRWEKEKRGILNDLSSERDKRHLMEQEIARQRQEVEEMKHALSSAANDTSEVDPQSKVNRLAQDPDAYIDLRLNRVVDEVVTPLRKEVESLKWERKFDKAYQWLGKQEKKDVDELYGSPLESEIVRITKEHGMGMMDPVEGTKAAYKIYQQELSQKELEEAKRNQTISNNSTSFVRTPPSSGSPRFTRAEIAAMPIEIFEKNQEAILEAQRLGQIS